MIKYSTILTNESGVNGQTFTDDGLTLKVSSPLTNRPGTNPEQLLGMAWATCLNATLKAILNASHMDNESRVRVQVDMMEEPILTGYYFAVKAYVSIKNIEIEETMKFAEIAHKRCPISKLIHENEKVSIVAEEY